ncbi:MAG: T9SS type A sorting domain-containing protein [Flavobacteriales bacterium]|nr:T9SS type A sorting domain-containing protein [Flavobacteriales bacterium]
MKTKVTILLCVLFASLSFGQVQSYKPADLVQFEKSIGSEFSERDVFKVTNDASLKSQLPAELTHYSLLTLDAEMISTIKSDRVNTFSLTLPVNDRNDLTLELVKVQIKTPDFKVLVMPQGTTLSTNSENVHYRGIIKGVPNSTASISFINGEVMGLVSEPNRAGNIVIGKLDNSDLHILYEDIDIQNAEDLSCESILAQGEMIDYAEDVLFGNTEAKSAGDCPRIYFDLSTVFLGTQGNNVTTASNYVEGVFNQVATLYANENVNILNSGMTAWTSNQPFATNLSAYASYRSSNSFNGDLGHLISTLGGGVAYISGLCTSGYKFGESGLTGPYYTVPTYSWAVNLLAHELGHNFGSRHTHDCAWNGNNTAIDGCGPAAGYNSGCNGPIPSNGGTIMSYCHLLSTGVNLSLGFGSQPGNVIRNTVLNSNCTTSCSSGGTGCNGAPEWQSGTTYYVGDQVTYQGGLYEYTVNGWVYLQDCSSNDPCAGVPEWQPISYQIGDYVTYQGDLYQWTANGWVYIGPCGSTGSSFATPPQVGVSIYPNPLEGNLLNIEVFNGMINSYRIVNHLGQVIQDANTNLGVIDVSSIKSGIYIIEITTVNGESFTEKFVKK